MAAWNINLFAEYLNSGMQSASGSKV